MRLRVCAAALLLTWSGAVMMAQQKVTTPEQLDKVMKQLQQSNQPVGKALASGQWADVRKGIAGVKEAVLLSQSFWIEHKKDDAVSMNKDTLAKIDAFEKIIATDTPDAGGRRDGVQGSRRQLPRLPQAVPRHRRGEQLHPQAGDCRGIAASRQGSRLKASGSRKFRFSWSLEPGA